MTPKESLLLEALQDIKANGPTKKEAGLCWNVDDYFYKRYSGPSPCLTTMTEIWQNWPKFSGDIKFPVPYGDLTYFRHANKWDGEYGDLRRELLDFLIAQLEQR